MTSAVELTGHRVRIREFTASDLDAVHAWSSDAETTRFLQWGPNDEPATTRFLERAMSDASAASRKRFDLGIELAGELIGAVSLRVDDDRTGAEVGFVLQREHWGRGLMAEAVGLVIEFGFDLGLQSVRARCDPDNRGARRVMEKVGMRYVGVLRDDVVINEVRRDSLSFVINRPT